MLHVKHDVVGVRRRLIAWATLNVHASAGVLTWRRAATRLI